MMHWVRYQDHPITEMSMSRRVYSLTVNTEPKLMKDNVSFQTVLDIFCDRPHSQVGKTLCDFQIHACALTENAYCYCYKNLDFQCIGQHLTLHILKTMI